MDISAIIYILQRHCKHLYLLASVCGGNFGPALQDSEEIDLNG